MKTAPAFVLLVFFLCAAGCSTVIQKTGEVMDGSAFREKMTAAYRTGGKNRGGKKRPPWVREKGYW